MPSDWNIRAPLEQRDELGEGPHWDEVAGELLHVDITAGQLHGWEPAAGRQWTLAVGGEVGAAISRAHGGLLLAVDRALVLRDADGSQRTLASVEPAHEQNRFNDCRCDATGRLWAGTMSRARTPGTAALYRLDPGGELERALGGTTISNGIGWSPDGQTMYFVDSTTQRIDALDFELTTGQIADRRPFAEIDAADGLPDGLAVDAEGGVWVCLFGGGAIRRYDADGTLDAVVPLPVTNPTCPAFGGPERATLFVTSARHRLTAEQIAREPLAGALLTLDPGVSGLPRHRFRG